MSSVVDFNILRRREKLLDEIGKLQEEIEILNLLLKKVRIEYMATDNAIKDIQKSVTTETAVSRKH